MFFINFKTIYFNIKWFGFKNGIKLPILINSNCIVKGDGKIAITGPIKPLMIKLGYGDVGIFYKKNKTILRNYGLIKFEGAANIGHGSKISIDKQGKLVLGRDFIITAESSIVCHNKITFKQNCLISWEVLIIDHDLHNIYDCNKKLINKTLPIKIGKDTWIGARVTILKGVNLPDNVIIASNSVITKSFVKRNIIIGGSPNRVLKENITWKR